MHLLKRIYKTYILVYDIYVTVACFLQWYLDASFIRLRYFVNMSVRFQTHIHFPVELMSDLFTLSSIFQDYDGVDSWTDLLRTVNCPAESMLWLLMTWRCKVDPCYWRSVPKYSGFSTRGYGIQYGIHRGSGWCSPPVVVRGAVRDGSDCNLCIRLELHRNNHFRITASAGPWFNKKMSSYQYRKSQDISKLTLAIPVHVDEPLMWTFDQADVQTNVIKQFKFSYFFNITIDAIFHGICIESEWSSQFYRLT